jgi:hypothetical protein
MTANKVAFKDLPENIKNHVAEMVGHRVDASISLVAGLSTAAVATAVVAGFVVTPGERKRLAGLAAYLLLPASIAGVLIGSDLKGFKRDCVELHRLLEREKADPKIQKLLKNNPYVIVNYNGDLVGKETARNFLKLRIWRRIETGSVRKAKAPKQERKRWLRRRK